MSLPSSRWLAASPSRVVWWFAVTWPVAVVLAVWGLAENSTILIVAAVPAAVALGFQAAVYVPRAIRARRGT
jgi:hypothetical protein